ncbi:hypothetical protein [Propionivibrio sp.]|uniref:hypothetical protein n=1 Tax=Propionivibrio sp. TaxID=2212460 RepID=UPI0039E26FDA
MHPGCKARCSGFFRWLWLPGAAAALYYYLWIWNPLPSDEEMIENFKTHRADFVEVVRRYREYPRPPGKDTAFWFKDGDTLELFKRAGIDSVDHDAWTPWLPNPYSMETAMNMENERKATGPFGLFYRYGALYIQPATTPRIDHPDRTDHRRHYRNTVVFGVIWKEYYFLPEIPRIENGELFGPLSIVGKGFPGPHQYHEQEGVATTQYRVRVFPSLNRLPNHWKGFECVYRQIEPQWFIRMCNGRH